MLEFGLQIRNTPEYLLELSLHYPGLHMFSTSVVLSSDTAVTIQPTMKEYPMYVHMKTASFGQKHFIES